jgi:hypothetical protein
MPCTNHPGAALQMSADPGMGGFEFRFYGAGCEHHAFVLVVRQDKKPLLPRQIEGLAHYLLCDLSIATEVKRNRWVGCGWRRSQRRRLSGIGCIAVLSGVSKEYSNYLSYLSIY